MTISKTTPLEPTGKSLTDQCWRVELIVEGRPCNDVFWPRLKDFMEVRTYIELCYVKVKYKIKSIEKVRD